MRTPKQKTWIGGSTDWTERDYNYYYVYNIIILLTKWIISYVYFCHAGMNWKRFYVMRTPKQKTWIGRSTDLTERDYNYHYVYIMRRIISYVYLCHEGMNWKRFYVYILYLCQGWTERGFMYLARKGFILCQLYLPGKDYLFLYLESHPW